MSSKSNVGAKSAAEEILQYIETLRSYSDRREVDKDDLLDMLRDKVEEIRGAACAGWYV